MTFYFRNIPSQRSSSKNIPGSSDTRSYVMQPVLAIEAPPKSQTKNSAENMAQGKTTAEMAAQDRVNAIKASLRKERNISTVPYY